MRGPGAVAFAPRRAVPVRIAAALGKGDKPMPTDNLPPTLTEAFALSDLRLARVSGTSADSTAREIPYRERYAVTNRVSETPVQRLQRAAHQQRGTSR